MKFSVVGVFVALVGSVLASNVLELKDKKEFDQVVVNSGKTTFVKFYADWCTHCKSMEPTWQELGDLFASKDDIQIVSIDGSRNKNIGRKYDITGYPTLKLFKADDVNHPIEFEGSRDLDAFKNFLTAHTGVSLYTPKVESNVVSLDDTNFAKKVLTSGKPALVAITASWCGHCKKLHPEFEKLASLFQHDTDSILIGEVSSSDVPAEELLKKYQVTGFPTILYFDPASSEPIPYEQGRTVDQLAHFVNVKANLHRDAETGDLLPSAGRIESLDSLIKKLLASPEDKSAAATDLLSEAEENSSEMAAYYKKLLNKLINGEDEFFSKESTRLAKILAGGKLARSKIDSMQKRLNVLDTFKS